MISKTLTLIAPQTILPALMCVGLLLFLSVFIGSVLWINRRGSQNYYQVMSQMPLQADNEAKQ